MAWFQRASSGNRVRLFSRALFPELAGAAATDVSPGPGQGTGGHRVVLAYSDHADLVARRSTDGGATWGVRRTLLDEPFPSEIGALPTNVDVGPARHRLGH